MSNLIRMIFPSVAGFANDAPAKPGGDGTANPELFGKILDDAKQNAAVMAKPVYPPNVKTEDGETDGRAPAIETPNVNPKIPKAIANQNQTEIGPIAQDAPEQLDASNKSEIAAELKLNPQPFGNVESDQFGKTGNTPVGSLFVDALLQNQSPNTGGRTVETGSKVVVTDSGRNPHDMTLDLSGETENSDDGLTQNDPEDGNPGEANSEQLTASMANMFMSPVNPLILQAQPVIVVENSVPTAGLDPLSHGLTQNVQSIPVNGYSEKQVQTAQAVIPDDRAPLAMNSHVISTDAMGDKPVQNEQQIAFSLNSSLTDLRKDALEPSTGVVAEFSPKGTPSRGDVYNPSISHRFEDLVKAVVSQTSAVKNGDQELNPKWVTQNLSGSQSEQKTVSTFPNATNQTSGSKNDAVSQKVMAENSVSIVVNSSDPTPIPDSADLKLIFAENANMAPSNQPADRIGNPVSEHQSPVVKGVETQTVQSESLETGKGNSDSSRTMKGQTTFPAEINPELFNQTVPTAQSVAVVHNSGLAGEPKIADTIQPIATYDQPGNQPNLQPLNVFSSAEPNPVETRPLQDKVENRANYSFPQFVAEGPVGSFVQPSVTLQESAMQQSVGIPAVPTQGIAPGKADQTDTAGNSVITPNPVDLKSLQSVRFSRGLVPSPDVISTPIKPISLFKNTRSDNKGQGEIQMASSLSAAGSTQTMPKGTEKTDFIAVNADTITMQADRSNAKTNTITVNGDGTPLNMNSISVKSDATSIPLDTVKIMSDPSNQAFAPFAAVFQKTGADVGANGIAEQSVSELSHLQLDGVKSNNASQPEKGLDLKSEKGIVKTAIKDDGKTSPIAQQPVVSLKSELEKPSVLSEASPAVNRDELFGQIMERAKVMIGRGHSEMEVNLKPDHLGKLQLRVAIENQVVTAKFAVESQQVKEIIETNLPQLRQQLHDQGIQVDALMVSVNLQNNGSNWQQPSGQQSHSQFSGMATRSKTEILPDGVEQPVVHRPGQNTLVDFIA